MTSLASTTNKPALLAFIISALRAIIEMLGLCLLGQGLLYLMAGQQRHKNPVYQIFALITRRPQQLVASLLPRNTRPVLSATLLLIVLFVIWIALAWMRKSL